MRCLPFGLCSVALVACAATPAAEAPRHIVDVSLRKTPHGTSFAVADPQTHAIEIVTAAHVVAPVGSSSRAGSGQTVEAEVAGIDEVRDAAVSWGMSEGIAQ